MLKKVILLFFSLVFTLSALALADDVEPKSKKNSIGVGYEYVSFDNTIQFSQFLSHEEKIDGSLFGLQFEHKNKLDSIEYRIKLNYLFANNLHFLGKAKFSYPFYYFESKTEDKYKASKFHISTSLFAKPQIFKLFVTEKLPIVEKFNVSIKPGVSFGYDSYSLQNERRLESIYVAPALKLSFSDHIDLTLYAKMERNYVKVFERIKTFSSLAPVASLSLEGDKVSFSVFYEKKEHEKFKTKNIGGSILFRF